MMVALWVSCAFVVGLGFRQFGFPPLVGFLAAGFGLNAAGVQPAAMLGEVAHLGVLLLLFTVGLKLRLRSLLHSEIWGTALTHLAVIGVLLTVVLWGGWGEPWPSAMVLAIALGFSSTVVAAKVLDGRRELRAFHGRVAIGILVVQDVIAVALLAVSGGHTPSPLAFGLLALPLAVPLLGRLLDLSGHGELLVLFGAVLALAVGGVGFEKLGLSPELGALLLGAMLSGHRRATELGNALWGLKEFFLVGFFLNIGFAGLPTWTELGIAVGLLAILPLKVALFFVILLLFRLRARSGFLASLSLATYSEFGLIVTQLAVDNGLVRQGWLVVLAIAAALSFALAAHLNGVAHGLYERFERRLRRFERAQHHPDDGPISLGSAEIAVVGMGRVGTGAYDFLTGRNEIVVGLDSDPGKVQQHVEAGRHVVYADAEDPGLWHRVRMDGIRAVLLAMPDAQSKIYASIQLRRRGYTGFISATHVYPEEREPILSAGCNATYSYFAEAGVGFAEHTSQALKAAD